MNPINTILIVDDDVDDQELLQEAIQSVDNTVRCLSAWNGEEALRLLQAANSHLPDLIFLDLNMPRMNGKTFLAKIKQSDGLSHIPVVIYSTSKLEEDIEQTRQLGAARFITKPDSFEGIVWEVSALMMGEMRVVS